MCKPESLIIVSLMVAGEDGLWLVKRESHRGMRESKNKRLPIADSRYAVWLLLGLES